MVAIGNVPKADVGADADEHVSFAEGRNGDNKEGKGDCCPADPSH